MWDEIKDVFTGPIGPWICLLALVVISLLWLEGERLLYTPITFAWAALVVARHFAFTVLDQYMLILAVYFGVYTRCRTGRFRNRRWPTLTKRKRNAPRLRSPALWRL